MVKAPIVGLLLVLGVGVAGGVTAAELRGQLSLVTAAGAGDNFDRDDAVVFFKPDAPVRFKPLAVVPTMTMRGKSFTPHVLPITLGSSVRFPNVDPILHNAFSVSPMNQFDLGLYKGASKTRVFDHPGLVRVFCNVHHFMFAYILVLDTPYFATVNDDGRFDLRGLPKGAGELVIWHPRAAVWREHLGATGGAPLAVRLSVQRNGVPAHFNKFGKPYAPDSGSKY